MQLELTEQEQARYQSLWNMGIDLGSSRQLRQEKHNRIINQILKSRVI